MAKDSTPAVSDSVAKRWLRLLKDYPISWFFVGIALALLADGSLRINLGSGSIAIMPPMAFAVKMCFRLLGLSIAILISFISVGKFLRQPKLMLYVGLTIWVVSSSALAWHYYAHSLPYRGAKAWSYSISDSTFTVIINNEALINYQGDGLVFALRIEDSSEANNDTAVVFSEPYTIGNNRDDRKFDLPFKSAKRAPKIGEVMQCFPIIVPSGVVIAGKHTIGELISLHAHLFLDVPITTFASIKEVNPSQIRMGYDQFADEQKELFLRNLPHRDVEMYLKHLQ